VVATVAAAVHHFGYHRGTSGTTEPTLREDDHV